jgi:hypothetical protein
VITWLEAGLVLMGGMLLGLAVAYLVWRRLSAPTRRHMRALAALEEARARAMLRQDLVGPRFPRVLAHLARICERAEAVLAEIQAEDWGRAERQQRSVAGLEDLIRHCRELEATLHPPWRPDVAGL